MKRIHTAVRVAQTFSIPLGAGTAILLGLLITYVGHAPTIAVYVYLSAILFGSYGLIKDTIQAIRVGNFALDYIALLAITVGVLSGHYLVATVIVLMLSGGEALEDYSLQKAQSSLARLANRLPHKVYLWQDGALSHPVSIDEVSVGAIIAVRKGEVIPLDGTLLSPPLVLVDESSLTGEAFPVDKKPGELIRSGTVNTTTTLTMQVTKGAADSTYRKIIQMVEAAQAEKAPLIRLADRYSGVFTLVTLVKLFQ
jgi:cation transport ATPase